MTRPFTLRNLANTLEHVSQNQASKSQILDFARRPHGESNKRARWQFDDEKYEILKDWVFRAAGAVVIQPQSFQLPEPKLAQRGQVPQTLSSPTTDDRLSAVPRTSSVRPRRISKVGANFLAGRSVAGGDIPSATAVDTFKAQDPFDAEIFNRRFHGAP